MAKNKKWILAAVAVLAVVLCCWAAWSKWASTTRIGLVNFQNYQTASLVKSNEDNFIEYEEIPLDRLDRLGRYDLVLGFGMGLKITEEQRAQILAAADEGTPIYIYAATNPHQGRNLGLHRQRQQAELPEYGPLRPPAYRREAPLRHTG